MVNDFIFKKPEEEGVDSARILKFIERIKERKTNLHSFMFVRHGNIIAEGYYKPFFHKDFMHRLYSCSKTYVSLAIGRLIGEGKIRLEDKLVDLFPEYLDREQDEWMRDCTVEDALKMAVPMLTDTYFDLQYNEWAWTFFNRQESLKPAGTVFSYNTSASFILDVLVEKLTGMTFLEYLRPVFDKIGVSKDIWCVKAPDGFSWGGSGVVCTLRDFAKVGELILHKGEYKGEQLLPRWYMEKATSKQICNLQDNHFSTRATCGYGYQIWITKHGFALYGMGSQYVFCFPDKDFMFVCQGDTQCNNDTEGDYIYEQVVHEVYEYLQDEPMEDKGNYARLQEELNGLSLHVDYGEAHSDFEKEIHGVKYVLKPNRMGWKWFSLSFEGEQGLLQYENERGVKKIPFGMNTFVQTTFPEAHYYDRQVMTPANREFDCLCSANWTEDKKLLLRVYIVDTNLGSWFTTFGFKGDEVGLMMHKRAEFFLDDGYVGWAGGKAER
ncbi:MAG: serine hydrolase [Clostridiales bacterium]|nr:serine hydrolase [Clostridiales bacterium]